MRIGVFSADMSYELGRFPVARGAAEPGVDHLSRSLIRHEKTAAAVQAALEEEGHSVVPIKVDGGLLKRLAEAAPELVFNTYFGPARRQDQAYVAAIMEYARMPFSGGDAACHFIGLSKPLTKRLLIQSGLPTPRSFVVEGTAGVQQALAASGLELPLVVKASGQGEGLGIDDRSVVRSAAQLLEAIERTVTAYGAPALVEEFMPGRELTVGVLDGAPPRALPVLEVQLESDYVYSYKVKSGGNVKEICPAELAEAEVARLADLAVGAGRAIGCRDYWRVDFRADVRGEMQILEVNTLPGLQPDYSSLAKMAGPAGFGFGGLVKAILGSAAPRATDGKRGKDRTR